MAVRGEVRADSTVGSVGSSTAGDGALHDDVVDEAVVDIKLGGLSVGSQVNEELTNSLDRLLGPATLSVLEGLALGVTANTTGVASEGNNLLVLENVVHVVDGLLEGETLGGAGDFVSVLVVGTKVRNSALSRCENEKIQGQTRNA